MYAEKAAGCLVFLSLAVVSLSQVEASSLP